MGWVESGQPPSGATNQENNRPRFFAIDGRHLQFRPDGIPVTVLHGGTGWAIATRSQSLLYGPNHGLALAMEQAQLSSEKALYQADRACSVLRPIAPWRPHPRSDR